MLHSEKTEWGKKRPDVPLGTGSTHGTHQGTNPRRGKEKARDTDLEGQREEEGSRWLQPWMETAAEQKRMDTKQSTDVVSGTRTARSGKPVAPRHTLQLRSDT